MSLFKFLKRYKSLSKCIFKTRWGYSPKQATAVCQTRFTYLEKHISAYPFTLFIWHCFGDDLPPRELLHFISRFPCSHLPWPQGFFWGGRNLYVHFFLSSTANVAISMSSRSIYNLSYTIIYYYKKCILSSFSD